eukprot:4288569-Lingulodinium_polyedra.AAC.1
MENSEFLYCLASTQQLKSSIDRALKVLSSAEGAAPDACITVIDDTDADTALRTHGSLVAPGQTNIEKRNNETQHKANDHGICNTSNSIQEADES